MNQLDYQQPFHPGPFAQQSPAPQAYHPHQPATTHQGTAISQGFRYPGNAGASLSSGPPQGFDSNSGLHQNAQSAAYTSAPASHSVNAVAAAPLVQQPQASLRQSSSPQTRHSPYAGAEGQQQFNKQPSPPVKYPMAAPPLPHTPGANSSHSPRTPQSPSSQALEHRRIDLLLDINLDLLQEINSLQAQGKGGATSPHHQAQLRAGGLSDAMAAEEYVQCLRRVQANLAYLAPRADVQQLQKAPPGPAHMTPPPHMPQLQAKYDLLREAFPDWIGHDMRPAFTAGSPAVGQTNMMNGNAQMQASARA
nr:hypothetical protein B0A51_13718 [Rachicladosporium sp. CCFEE 5018]